MPCVVVQTGDNGSNDGKYGLRQERKPAVISCWSPRGATKEKLDIKGACGAFIFM